MKTLLVAVNSKFVHTNLAVRYIKKYCSDFNISIKEYTINDMLYKVLNDIYVDKPDIVGFSCYIWNIDMVLKLSRSLKKIDPKIIIILGGPEVSYDPAAIMEENGCVDYIIRGEGEVSTKQLLNYLEGQGGNISEIGGLVYRKDGKININSDAPYIKNLDMLPFPYAGEEKAFQNKIIYYESSRGCPFNCSYCLSSTVRGVRFFSLERVKRDLMWFIDNNISLVKFVDRTFNCGSNYREIFKFLAENMKNTRFHFEISADILDKETIEFLKTVPSGLFQFEAGVQSTNTWTLKEIDRNMSLSNLYKNIQYLRENDNIHLHLDLIAGLPGEDYASFKRSFDDVFKLRPHMIQLGFLKLLKGSKLREESDKYGIVYNDYPPYEVLKTRDISFDEISRLKEIESVVDRYYNSGRFNASIKYLLSKFESPFELFENLSSYLKFRCFIDRAAGNNEQYKLLYDFCVYGGFNEILIIKDCLAFDYLLQGRNPSVPQFLSPVEHVEKDFVWYFLSDESNIKKYLPHYSGMDVKEIMKHLHVRIFSFNIPCYLADNIVRKNRVAIFFDYGFRQMNGEPYYFSVDL